jgi:putative oxidoreductase
MFIGFLESKVESAYVLLRVVAGLMFFFHGVQKLFGVLTNFQPPVLTQLWFGGIIELVTGIAIALGAFTPWAAFLASGTMAVAYIQFHWKVSLGAQFFPTINQGELALLYSVLFLFIACRGSGMASVDARRAASRQGASRRPA